MLPLKPGMLHSDCLRKGSQLEARGSQPEMKYVGIENAVLHSRTIMKCLIIYHHLQLRSNSLIEIVITIIVHS